MNETFYCIFVENNDGLVYGYEIVKEENAARKRCEELSKIKPMLDLRKVWLSKCSPLECNL